MAGIFNIATSGLNSYQRALAVTGNNIANANTPGYSRQTAEFKELPTQKFGGAYIGNGVILDNVLRSSDEFANRQFRTTFSVKSQYDTFYQQSSQIDQLLSNDASSVSTTMQGFFNSVSQMNDSPENMAYRQFALSQGDLLVQQFKTTQIRLDEYQYNTADQLGAIVNKVNEIGSNIASVNRELYSSPNAPDLLDQRDQLLQELSGYVDVKLYDQGNGSMNVAIGTGQSLVLGGTSRSLSITSSIADMSGTTIAIGNGAGLVEITNSLHSGMIGGLLDFQETVIKHSSQILGQMAIGMAQTFNAQHKLGVDLNNQLGKDFFTDYNAAEIQLNRSVASNANAGTGVLSVAITDISQTVASDYNLVVTNTAANEVRLIRESDGKSFTLNWTDTPPAPPAAQIQLDGMTIQFDDVGNLVNNDQYTISPTRGAAKDLVAEITKPEELALAAPVRVQATLANTGTGAIKLGDVNDTINVANDYRIDFISGTQYNLVNVTTATTTGPFAFTPNSDNVINVPSGGSPSYTVHLSGIPNTGDSFTMGYNSGGTGDNYNGLKLANIQQASIFSSGTENLFSNYSGLVSDIGTKTYKAQQNGITADTNYKAAQDFRESKSGVNLDEEAANLLRFQRSYTATSKLLLVARDIMDVLFSTMR